VYNVRLYFDEKGRVPVQEFLSFMQEGIRQKFYRNLEQLEQLGPQLGRPYADKVRDNLYEFRIRFGSDNIRILYFFMIRDVVILAHAFKKDQWKLSENDIQLAERRRNDFLMRYWKGDIKLDEE